MKEKEINDFIHDFIQLIGGGNKFLHKAGLIFCVVVSPGYQAQDWCDLMDEEGIKYDDFQDYLQADSFKPLPKGTCHIIAIVPPNLLLKRSEAEAKEVALKKLQSLMPSQKIFLKDGSLEIALLLRDKLATSDISDMSLTLFGKIIVAQEGLLTAYGQFIPGIGCSFTKPNEPWVLPFPYNKERDEQTAVAFVLEYNSKEQGKKDDDDDDDESEE